MQKNLLADYEKKYFKYFSNSTRISLYLTGAYQEAFFEWLNFVDKNCFRHGFSDYLNQNYQMFSAFFINVNSGCSDNNINKTPGRRI